MSSSPDVVIFGGGAAGLWLLDALRHRGDDVVLLEADGAGGGQTGASQGIIHGGLKYTLSGLLTPSARAIRMMPAVWRAALAGETRPDLSATRLRAEFCHLWQTESIRSRLGMVGARAGLRIAPTTLDLDARPEVLRDVPGTVARLDEQVIEPESFAADLLRQHADVILRIDAASGLEFVTSGPGQVDVIRLLNPETGEPLDLQPRCVVLTAGAGNERLRDAIGLPSGAMQRRPLHMVVARGDLPVVNGHCVDGLRTRATITTTRDWSERTIWQIGGQIAEDGVGMEPLELIRHAERELTAILPGARVSGREWITYQVDRAEPVTRGRHRPALPESRREGNVVTAWPTKLALAPVLTDEILRLTKPRIDPPALALPDDWPRPEVALPPWEDEDRDWVGL